MVTTKTKPVEATVLFRKKQPTFEAVQFTGDVIAFMDNSRVKSLGATIAVVSKLGSKPFLEFRDILVEPSPENPLGIAPKTITLKQGEWLVVGSGVVSGMSDEELRSSLERV